MELYCPQNPDRMVSDNMSSYVIACVWMVSFTYMPNKHGEESHTGWKMLGQSQRLSVSGVSISYSRRVERRNLELAFWTLCRCQGGPQKPSGLGTVSISVVSTRVEPQPQAFRGCSLVSRTTELLSVCLWQWR